MEDTQNVQLKRIEVADIYPDRREGVAGPSAELIEAVRRAAPWAAKEALGRYRVPRPFRANLLQRLYHR
jgi:hypothetical protein